MSNLAMFFQGKKNFITTNDFKHFLNEEILINAKEEPYFHEPSSIIELAKSPIRNLNNEVLENVYILKYISNHTNVSDFLCIVDNTNKVIILNEKILLREINYETLNIDDKLFNIAIKLRYKPIIDIDYVTITSEEIDYLNQKLLTDKLDDFTIIGVSKINSLFKEEIDKYIFKIIDKAVEKFYNKEDLKEIIEEKAKTFFIKESNLSKVLNSDYYKINYTSIIYDMIRKHNYTEDYLYNYYTDKNTFMDYFERHIERIIQGSDYVINLDKYFNLKALYIFKQAVLLFDKNKEIYENDNILVKMREISRVLKADMKTININGEKRNNDPRFNFKNGTMNLSDFKDKYERFSYNLNDNIEIKYGKKTLIKF